MKALLIAALFASQAAFADSIAELCPVAENVRGHENTEWSISYAYHLTDAKKSLPRVLLVGDSICQGYQGKVRAKLEGKANVTYWASSYCVTSPGYLRLLAFYLDEAKYDVIHFNNGLHSCETPIADYEKAYSNALRLIKDRQPGAKIVWASSTPLNMANAERPAKVVQLNAAARPASRRCVAFPPRGKIRDPSSAGAGSSMRLSARRTTAGSISPQRPSAQGRSTLISAFSATVNGK